MHSDVTIWIYKRYESFIIESTNEHLLFRLANRRKILLFLGLTSVFTEHEA